MTTPRFLLFCLGLVGAGMVATGHLLWAAKRWPKDDAKARRSVLVVDRLNAAVFAGLPIAISGYLWANRLLPAQTAERAAQEQSAIFAVWASGAVSLTATRLQSAWLYL